MSRTTVRMAVAYLEVRPVPLRAGDDRGQVQVARVIGTGVEKATAQG